VTPRGTSSSKGGVIDVLGRLGLGHGQQGVSQTQRAHIVAFRGLHDLDERLVEAAAAQGAMSTP
jgi:hypothetical protein